MNIALIVTDAGPLITLAVADALDTLKLLQTRILIPDMVYFEVTRYVQKPGAQIVISWLQANRQVVEIAATEEFVEFSELLSINPAARTRNRGEHAAAEVLFNALEKGADAGLLLFEDSDIRTANFLVRLPDNVLILSTSTFLYGLQRRNLIQDADAILNRATAVRSPTALAEAAFATRGAQAALNAWTN
jgi:predicted nucleic acid-binding protein